MNRISETKRNKIIELLDRDWTVARISRETGVSRKAIDSIRTGEKGFPPELLAEWDEVYEVCRKIKEAREENTNSSSETAWQQ